MSGSQTPGKVLILGTALSRPAMDLARDAGLEVTTTDRYVRGAEFEDLIGKVDPDAVIVRLGEMTQAAIDRAPRLKVIAKHGVGYDTIDIAAAARRGIPVTIATGANAISVAEHALGLLLAVARGIVHLDRRMRAGHWDKATAVGTELSGKTLGVVGLGAIGRHLAMLCRCFGMEICVFDPALGAEDAQRFVQVGSFDEIVERCDVISLHCPLNDKTRNLIGAKQLAAMRAGAIIINTARGGLIDLEALVDALEEGRIGGAGLDTFPVEPAILSDRLRALPNIVVSPHVGANTHEARERVGMTAMRQVIDILENRAVEKLSIVNDALLAQAVARTA